MYKQHCDLCDAVIPPDQGYVYLVRSTDYHNRDWRYTNNPPVGCYPCLRVLLDHIPDTLKEAPCPT